MFPPCDDNPTMGTSWAQYGMGLTHEQPLTEVRTSLTTVDDAGTGTHEPLSSSPVSAQYNQIVLTYKTVFRMLNPCKVTSYQCA